MLENGTPVGSSVVWQTLIAEEDIPPHDLNLELVSFTNRVETPVSFYRLRRLWIPSGRGISGSKTDDQSWQPTAARRCGTEQSP